MLSSSPRYTPWVTLELRNISKSYDGGRTNAVEDVSFTVASGELVVLVGESGCGKTTTLKIINRLVEPTNGQVLIDGSDVAEREAVELRRSIGYVFQGIGLFPHLSIAHNVGIIPTLLGWDEEQISHRVSELLELVRLDPEEYGSRMPAELSGGQRQRVGFARALAAGPSLMLLDEPFGALDPITREDLRTEFRQIQKELDLTAVLVTHDMTEALLTGDRIIVMRGGRIVGRGQPAKILRDPGDPYVARLMESPTRHAERLAAMTGNDRTRP
ncbi:MAG: ATP-binding cassette domain-containing protein [Acidobacteria bacterium]|nr:ATP-binding cassette domain-containing protein [Acidobacteriota bacterium]